MRRTAAALLIGGLLVTGCSDDKKPSDDGQVAVPTPVATIPVEVAGLPFGVGEYVVDFSADLSSEVRAAAVDEVGAMAGVQSSKVTAGRWHIEILPDATQTQREAVLRQLAALGKVSEGI